MVVAFAALAACGKKGPPLAPLRLVPGPVSDLTVRRVGPDVQLRFKLPTSNANAPGRIDLDHVEVYAVTVAPGSVIPPNRDLLTKTYLVGTIPVKPLPVEGEDQPVEGVPPDTRPSPGDEASFIEELTEARMTPAPLPKAPLPPVPVPTLPPITPFPGDDPLPGVLQVPGTATLPAVPPLPEPPPAPAGPPPATATGGTAPPAPAAAAPVAAVPPAPVQTTIVRIYTLRGVSAKGRAGQPSARVTIPLVPPPPPPSSVKTTFTENAVVVEWTPPASERSGTALTFNVYRAGTKPEAVATPAPAAKPAASQAPPKPETPLNAAPLAARRFEVAGLDVGAEQCFAIRSVEVVQNVPVEGDAVKAECVTPKDIFPPAAPQGLSLLLLDGAIELVWDASTEADFAGYTVLRADAPDGTLRPLTPSPIRETTFRDTTVRSGARYTYAIVAVDRSGNASPPSARVEGTAR